MKGWKVWKADDWTRKGYGKQKNTNIDIVIYKDIEDLDIDIQCLGYDEISDHKAIKVSINLPQEMEEKREKQKIEIVDKKILK